MTPPKVATLKRYGLSLEDWATLLEMQGGTCAVCRKEPRTGRLCVDHEHVRGWKKMAPEERRRYVRGLLCWFCNHWYVGRSITVAKAQNVVAYLTSYQARRA